MRCHILLPRSRKFWNRKISIWKAFFLLKSFIFSERFASWCNFIWLFPFFTIFLLHYYFLSVFFLFLYYLANKDFLTILITFISFVFPLFWHSIFFSLYLSYVKPYLRFIGNLLDILCFLEENLFSIFLWFFSFFFSLFIYRFSTYFNFCYILTLY